MQLESAIIIISIAIKEVIVLDNEIQKKPYKPQMKNMVTSSSSFRLKY